MAGSAFGLLGSDEAGAKILASEMTGIIAVKFEAWTFTGLKLDRTVDEFPFAS